MSDNPTTTHPLFSLLEGTWRGEGQGEYPTIKSFDYRETLVFTRYDEKTLAYEQRTEKRYVGQTEWFASHWQNGFIRVFENGELDLMNVQIGRTEVMTGSVELLGAMFRIHFVSKEITGDPRMVSSARTFELEGNMLRYEMEMQTTAVAQMVQHLKIALKRVK